MEDSYGRFRSRMATNKTRTTTPMAQEWIYRDSGNKEGPPLLCLPPLSGSADCYFLQMSTLSAKGYRVISVNLPPYVTRKEFVTGLLDFLTTLELDQVHILGSGLGAFLALMFAESQPSRVASLVLSNPFISTVPFGEGASITKLLRFMPAFWLKKSVLGNFPQPLPNAPVGVSEAVDFMVQQLDGLERSKVVARMTLNITPYTVHQLGVPPERVTIIGPLTEKMMEAPAVPLESTSSGMRTPRETKSPRGGRSRFPIAELSRARHAEVKQCLPAFCFLANADEFNLHTEVHLRNVMGTVAHGGAPAMVTRELAEQDKDTFDYDAYYDECNLRSKHWDPDVAKPKNEPSEAEET